MRAPRMLGGTLANAAEHEAKKVIEAHDSVVIFGN